MSSARVHSRYTRRLVGSAIGGREVLLTLQARQQHRTIYAEHGTEAGTIPTTTPTPAP